MNSHPPQPPPPNPQPHHKLAQLSTKEWQFICLKTPVLDLDNHPHLGKMRRCEYLIKELVAPEWWWKDSHEHQADQAEPSGVNASLSPCIERWEHWGFYFPNTRQSEHTEDQHLNYSGSGGDEENYHFHSCKIKTQRVKLGCVGKLKTCLIHSENKACSNFSTLVSTKGI